MYVILIYPASWLRQGDYRQCMYPAGLICGKFDRNWKPGPPSATSVHSGQCHHGYIYLDLFNVLRPPFCTLTTHWVNEDDWWESEIGLKEKPEDTRSLDTSKWLHQHKNRSTGSADKGLDSQLCHYWELWTWESAGASRLKGPKGGEIPARWHLQRYNQVFN